jgi:hypothetical protein
VNYEFHDELKPDLVPGIIDSYRKKETSTARENSGKGENNA